MKRDYVFPLRKYQTLKLLMDNGGIMSIEELALKQDVDRKVITDSVRHYEKQNLVIYDREDNICEITDKGIDRFAFLDIKLKTERNSLRIPGDKLKTALREMMKKKYRDNEKSKIIDEYKRKKALGKVMEKRHKEKEEFKL